MARTVYRLVSKARVLFISILIPTLLLTGSPLSADVSSLDTDMFVTPNTDSCSGLAKLSSRIEALGGGTIRIHGALTSSCRWRIADVPVEVDGSGIATCSLTFTTPDAGLAIEEDDGHKRIGIRGCNFYARNDTQLPAVGITFPEGNAPDSSATLHNLQIGSNDSASFLIGVRCENCTHHEFQGLDIQGQERTTGGAPIGTCLSLRGFSANGKIIDLECTNARMGIVESGRTEGTKIFSINTVAVDYGIVLDDQSHSLDPTAMPFTPGPQIQGWHCDAFRDCFVSRGWNQTFIENFNFYKRSESHSDWVGISLASGSYGGKVFPTTHTKINFGRCAQNGTQGENICIKLGEQAFANSISDVEPDGMTYFVDESKSSSSNVIRDNTAFPATSIFYPGQYSILKGWRKDPSPLNFNRGNYPPLIGEEKAPTLTPNSSTPDVGGFGLRNFHTKNSRKTRVVDFLHGFPGQIVSVVADDDNTIILNSLK